MLKQRMLWSISKGEKGINFQPPQFLKLQLLYESNLCINKIWCLWYPGCQFYHLEVQLSQASTALKDNYTYTCQVGEFCLTLVVVASCAGQQGLSSSALHRIFSIASSWASTEVWRPFGDFHSKVSRLTETQKPNWIPTVSTTLRTTWMNIWPTFMQSTAILIHLELDCTCNTDTPVPAEHLEDVCNWLLIPAQEQE